MDLKKTHNKCKEVFALMFSSMSGKLIGLTLLTSLHSFIVKQLYLLPMVCREEEGLGWGKCYISL